MDVKAFRSKRDNYKSTYTQHKLKRKKKSYPTRRKHIFVPAAWVAQSLRRWCPNLPNTGHIVATIQPQPCFGLTSTTPCPSLTAKIYKTQEPPLPVDFNETAHIVKMFTHIREQQPWNNNLLTVFSTLKCKSLHNNVFSIKPDYNLTCEVCSFFKSASTSFRGEVCAKAYYTYSSNKFFMDEVLYINYLHLQSQNALLNFTG